MAEFGCNQFFLPQVIKPSNIQLFQRQLPHKVLTTKVNVHDYHGTSVDNFEHDFQQHRIPINTFQRALLSVGSAAVSILDPHRADMIACLGEVTGNEALKYMLHKMESSEEGSRILKERPRINTKTIDLQKLESLPDDTLGKIYSTFLKDNKVTPDSRMTVQFVDNVQLAYVIQRYREVHDLVHAVLRMPTTMLGEVTVKWVEAIQTRLPMCIGGAIFGPVRLKPKHRMLYVQQYLPWAIHTGFKSKFLLNIFFEERWEQKLDFYKEMNIKHLVLKHRMLYVQQYLPWAIHTGINSKFLLNIYFEERWEQKLDDFYKEMNIKHLVLK